MATIQDLETGDGSLSVPLIKHKEEAEEEMLLQKTNNSGGLWMVFFCTFIAVCGSFEFGSCVGYSAPTQFDIMADLKLSSSQFSFFGSVLTLGGMLGAITSGSIADIVGRKGAMRISSISCVGGWLAIYLSVEIVLLNIGRFSTGLGIGILSYVLPVYIAEISPKEYRGSLTTANQVFIYMGMTVAFITGAFVSWRTLALTGIIPCMVLLFGLYFIPESPRWLAMVGNENEFVAVLRKLRGANANILEEQTELMAYAAATQLHPKVTVVDLLGKRNMRGLIVGAGLMVFQQFGGYNGIVFFASEIFVSAGFSPSVGNILYGTIQIVITALGAGLVDRAGRKPLLLISVCGMLFGSLLTGTSFYLKVHQLVPEIVPILAVSGIMVYMGFYSVGLGSIPWVIMSEVFSTSTQGMAGSLVSLVNWFGSWSVSFSFTFLLSWSPHGTFFLFAVVIAVAVVFIIRVVPETKGRTLQEIHASMD